MVLLKIICVVLAKVLAQLFYVDDVKVDVMVIKGLEDYRDLKKLNDKFEGWCSVNSLILRISKRNFILNTRNGNR